MIKDAIHKKELKGLMMNKSCPLLSHLFFADDVVFFIEATTSNVLKFYPIDLLRCYMSGCELPEFFHFIQQ